MRASTRSMRVFSVAYRRHCRPASATPTPIMAQNSGLMALCRGLVSTPYGEGSRTLRQTTIFRMPPGAGSMPSAW